MHNRRIVREEIDMKKGFYCDKDGEILSITENESNNSDFKSNNFEVKSNNELFKQALVEGLNRHFDKTIEEAKKIEQIEEMIEIVKPFVSGLACEEESGSCELTDCRSCNARNLSNNLYNKGWRKQSDRFLLKENGEIIPLLPKQSEWISVEDRLPEDYNKYLLFLENGRIAIGWYHGDAMQFVEDGIVMIETVTHWMLLPEAPNMKGGE